MSQLDLPFDNPPAQKERKPTEDPRVEKEKKQVERWLMNRCRVFFNTTNKRLTVDSPRRHYEQASDPHSDFKSFISNRIFTFGNLFVEEWSKVEEVGKRLRVSFRVYR